MDKDEKKIEIYTIHSQLADNVSERRSKTNQFFITLIADLENISDSTSLFMLLGASIFGILLCYIWIINIESYRQLNSGKFKTLHELEKDLPFNFFEKEWENLGKGQNAKKYKKLSEVEKNIPKLLMTPFIIGV